MKNTTAREATTRLQALLVKDKVQAPEGFTDILKSDLMRLLNDYFELSGGVCVDIKLTEASDFDIHISAKAHRIKTFYCSK
ncbi:MAG TPA: cell division topological specificity factor MinE [Clostridia bacterium]|nr:cell division topological specificity factor MinE [Clostridia bacterium]